MGPNGASHVYLCAAAPAACGDPVKPLCAVYTRDFRTEALLVVAHMYLRRGHETRARRTARREKVAAVSLVENVPVRGACPSPVVCAEIAVKSVSVPYKTTNRGVRCVALPRVFRNANGPAKTRNGQRQAHTDHGTAVSTPPYIPITARARAQ